MKGYMIVYDTVDTGVEMGEHTPLPVTVLCRIGGDGVEPQVWSRWIEARRSLDLFLEMCPGYADMGYRIIDVNLVTPFFTGNVVPAAEKGWRKYFDRKERLPE